MKPKDIKKLTKTQEKRFDEAWDNSVDNIIGDCEYWDGYVDIEKEKDKLKQFLANELSKQKKEIIEEAGKGFYQKDVPDWIEHGSREWEAFYQGWTKRSKKIIDYLDQAINQINKELE